MSDRPAGMRAVFAVGDPCSVDGKLGQIVKLDKGFPMEDGTQVDVARVWIEGTGCIVTVPVMYLDFASAAEDWRGAK